MNHGKLKAAVAGQFAAEQRTYRLGLQGARLFPRTSEGGQCATKDRQFRDSESSRLQNAYGSARFEAIAGKSKGTDSTAMEDAGQNTDSILAVDFWVFTKGPVSREAGRFTSLETTRRTRNQWIN